MGFGKLNPSISSDEARLVAFITTRLTGAADNWANILEDHSDPCLKSWSLFEEAFLAEFAVTRTQWQHRIKLVSMKQGNSSISDFTSKFKAAAMFLPGFGDEAFLTHFC